MREHSWNRLRDRVVRVLAGVSLVAVLAVLGALFVGSAASSQPDPVAADGQAAESAQRGARDQVQPAGLILGAVVIGGGLVVLAMGAFKPPTSGDRREFAEQLRR